MDILQNLGSLAGWPGLIFLILFVIFNSLYLWQTSKSQAAKIARKADVEAIEAQQRQINIMADRIKYLEAALEEVGIRVTVDGKIIHIKNDKEQC